MLSCNIISVSIRKEMGICINHWRLRIQIHARVPKWCQDVTTGMVTNLKSNILDDPHQVLYRQCLFGEGECKKPVVFHQDSPFCDLHVQPQSFHPRIGKQKDTASEDIIDVTTETAMDMSCDPGAGTSTQDSGSLRTGSLDPDLEEVLMRKGKYLLQHLKGFEEPAGNPD